MCVSETKQKLWHFISFLKSTFCFFLFERNYNLIIFVIFTLKIYVKSKFILLVYMIYSYFSFYFYFSFIEGPLIVVWWFGVGTEAENVTE